MSVFIEELGITVSGNINRKFNLGSNVTTLKVTAAQAQSLYDSLGSALNFFASQSPVPVDDAPLIKPMSSLSVLKQPVDDATAPTS
jgi:hypothetical protein